MQHPVHALLVFGSGITGHQHIGADSQADEQPDQQENQGTVSAYRGQGIAAGEAADHSRIR